MTIHHHIHLHCACGNHRRPHQLKNLAHTRVTPLKVQAKPESDTAKRGPLGHQLRQTAKQRAYCETHQRARTKARVQPPCKTHAAHDGSDVEKTGRHGGRTENIFGV